MCLGKLVEVDIWQLKPVFLKLFHVKEPTQIRSQTLIPHLIRFCPLVPHLIRLLFLNVLLRECNESLTEIVMHFVIVLLRAKIIMKINVRLFSFMGNVQAPVGYHVIY